MQSYLTAMLISGYILFCGSCDSKREIDSMIRIKSAQYTPKDHPASAYNKDHVCVRVEMRNQVRILCSTLTRRNQNGQYLFEDFVNADGFRQGAEEFAKMKRD